MPPMIQNLRSDYLQGKKERYSIAFKYVLLTMLIVSAFLSAYLLTLYQKYGPIPFGFAMLFTLLTGIRVFRQGFKDLKSYRRGEKNYGSGDSGELRVLKELGKLSEHYYVYPDIMIPGKRGNIDFVVVGPNAIFLIEVKNHSGQIYYAHGGVYQKGGFRRFDFIRQCEGEIQKLNEYLKGPLSNYRLVPILLFSNYKATVSVKYPVSGVNVMKIKNLIPFILNYKEGINHNTQRVVEVLKPLIVKV